VDKPARVGARAIGLSGCAPCLRQERCPAKRRGHATPGLAGAGCAQACRPRCWRFIVWTPRGAVHRHAAQPGLWSFLTALSQIALQHAAGVFRPTLGLGSCLHHGACRLSLYAEKPSRPSLLAGRSACTSLSCREPWQGTASLGPIGRNRPAQTISPPPLAASSRDKFFVPPGPACCYGRWRGAASPPPPTGSQQGRTGATLIS